MVVVVVVLQVHPFKFDVDDMPDTFMTTHRALARAKFSYAVSRRPSQPRRRSTTSRVRGRGFRGTKKLLLP